MRRNRAFTLLEVVLVIALLAILMSMVMPRLIISRGRGLELAAERVADVLTMFAQRESLSGRPVGIWHDAQRNWIVLVALEAAPEGPGDAADWRPDRAVAPAKLPDSVDPDRGVLAVVDGRAIDFRQWPIASEPGKPRPRLEITLADGEGREQTVVLPPHAIAPYLASDEHARLAAREPIDLDAAGRWREDW
jgi:prepilin-type N-terminal cleavage/methylation domain-containing protein